MIPTVLVLVFVVFLMIRLIPGDPAVTMLGVQATPERVEELRHHLGLDRSLPVQFGIFVRDLARADLGDSIVVRTPVSDLIKQRLPLTLFLVAYAMLLALIITVPLAVIAALKRDSLIDQCIRTFSVVMISTPGFWIGLLLLIVLGVKAKSRSFRSAVLVTASPIGSTTSSYPR
jgi:peptide/nickel transport system permease protein